MVQVVFVRVQEDVGVHHHGVGRPLQVGNDCPVVVLPEYHPEPGLDQVQHDVRGVPPHVGRLVVHAVGPGLVPELERNVDDGVVLHLSQGGAEACQQRFDMNLSVS